MKMCYVIVWCLGAIEIVSNGPLKMSSNPFMTSSVSTGLDSYFNWTFFSLLMSSSVNIDIRLFSVGKFYRAETTFQFLYAFHLQRITPMDRWWFMQICRWKTEYFWNCLFALLAFKINSNIRNQCLRMDEWKLHGSWVLLYVILFASSQKVHSSPNLAKEKQKITLHESTRTEYRMQMRSSKEAEVLLGVFEFIVRNAIDSFSCCWSPTILCFIAIISRLFPHLS